jgi:hypothetical protein
MFRFAQRGKHFVREGLTQLLCGFVTSPSHFSSLLRVYHCYYSRSTGNSMAGSILASSLAHIELKHANNKSARD